MPNVAIGLAVRVRRQPIKLLLALGLNLAACWPALASQFYDLEIVARTDAPVAGQTVTGFKKECSINDAGTVAFIAYLPSGQGVFRKKLGQSVQYLTPADVSSSKEFGSVWLNNQNQIATSFIVSGNPKVDYVRRYAGGNSAHDVIAMGSAARDRYGNAQYPFDNIYASLAMNTKGAIAFSGQIPFTTFTALTNTAGTNKLSFGGFADLRPVIADDGRVAVQSGAQLNSPILLWGSSFTNSVGIATGGGGFIRMGKSPGISGDGSIVVFCGDRGNGLGVFASLQQNSTNPFGPRTIVKIVGENGGTSGPSSELGTNSQGNPLYFSSFDTDARVGIVHFTEGQDGVGEDSFTVCFIGTPNLANDSTNGVPFSAANGVWTAQVAVDATLQAVVTGVLPVVQIGESVAGETNSITDVGLYDPIAKVTSDATGNPVPADEGNHCVAIWASTATGTMIVSATHLEGDLTLHQLQDNALDLSTPLTIDSQLNVLPNPQVLANQPKVGLGLVADGVTPLLIKFQPKETPVQPTQFHITLTVDSQGGSIATGPLSSNLFVLANGQFVQGTNLLLSPTTPAGFAYITGIRAEDLLLATGKVELAANIRFYDDAGATWQKSFGIRRPPILLVHGYASSLNTWSPDFLSVLRANRARDFVIPVQYGVSSNPTLDPQFYPNTYKPFGALAPELDLVLRRQIEKTNLLIRKNWAFTRYDVVGHSQGGLLLRMLCSQSDAFVASPDADFLAQRYRFRGRFRRAITIGSPHNGSTLAYYSYQLLDRSPTVPFPIHPFPTPLYAEMPWALRWWLGVIQPKFSPWSGEFQSINDPTNSVYAEAKFHAITTRIGNVSIPRGYYWIGLGFDSRRQVVIPAGADGIVDFDSEGGGLGTPASIVLGDIAHASSGFRSLDSLLFGIPPEHAQTLYTNVASQVVSLLDGPVSAFGAFVLPQRLPQVRKDAIDAVIPDYGLIVDIGRAILTASSAPVPSSTPRKNDSNGTTFNLVLQAPDGVPILSNVVWFAEAFGTHGLTGDGISLQVNTNDSTKVAVLVDDSVRGDAVVYATYSSTNGTLAFAQPFVVVSRPPGTNLVGIQLVPPQIALSVGDKVPLEIWGTYNNGFTNLMFVPPDQPAIFSSSNTNVVTVDAGGFVTLRTNGSATVTASFRGFTSQNIISTLAPFIAPTPPVAVADSATSIAGQVITINVLANDYSATEALDPSTVAVTDVPTNGTTSVDSFSGAITYTPNPGTTNVDTFRYTVEDDLGTTSNEGMVTVTNIVINSGGADSPLTPIADYLVIPVTSGNVDHRYPRINNLGEVVYQSPVGGFQQVWKKPAGDPTMSSASQVTFPTTNYGGATSPGIADDGSFICYRANTNASPTPKDILKYPGPAAALTNPLPAAVFSASGDPDPGVIGFYTIARTEPSLCSDGKPVFSYASARHSLSGENDFYNTYLIVGDRAVSPGNSWNGLRPDANDQSHFVFGTGSQIFLDNQFLTNGSTASINDAPRDKPEVVYVNGTNLMSTLFGQLDGGAFASTPISGSWVDVNSNGVVVFEKLVNGNYQVYKAYPWEARIVSRGGTNGLVGLPYKYDGDNVAEAYGGPEPLNDPREATPIEWSVVEGPAGYTIDANTGHINWIPSAPGNYTAVIRAANWNLALGDVADLETININVTQSTMQVVDAVDFRTPGTPNLATLATNYVTGGTPRIGVLADGASRLVLRAPLVGAETNAFPNLHFAIGGANVSHDGLLRSVSGSAWTGDVPATISSLGATNLAMCLYESPLDFDAASQPVTIHLLNGTNIIATQTVQLRRPPVVLVHDGWSGPETWGVLISELFDAGMDVQVVDYEFTAGSSLTANDTKIFLKGNEALAVARQSGFAASRFDLIGHGSGGVLSRLHAQRYAAQDTNYRKGDVHKLITIGAPHQGSWLAAALLGLRTNNPALFSSLHSAVLSSSEAAGYYPPIDLNAGLMDDLAPRSVVLMQLETTAVPSYAIAATINTLPPGDPISFIQYYLGLSNQGDGLVTTNSAFGGIQTNASTVFTNSAHVFEPTDANVVARAVALLRQSVSDHFGFFPPAEVQTNQLTGTVATNIGTWLSLSGATNGQTFAPGQMVSLAAVAGGGHVLQSVQFISPPGSALVTTGLFSFNCQILTQAVGRVVISAAGRDTSNEVAFASVALNVTPAFALQSLVVEPSPAVFTVKSDLPLRVLGLYADGVQRDLTLEASGTKYKSSGIFNIGVSSNGVLHLIPPGPASPVTVSITNGTVWTNVQVTVALSNLPPTPVITADRISGPAPFDVQFNGSNSIDANGDQLNYLWDFGDGTASTQQIPPVHRFWIPGTHVVTLTVTDPSGLVGFDRFTVTVEDRLIVDGVILTLTNWTAYGEVVVTNGALLIAPIGLSRGNVFVNASTNILSGSNFLYSLSLRSNAVLTVPALVALDLTVSNMVVDASSRVDLMGKGYAGGTGGSGDGQGPGGGRRTIRDFGGGGSYGGLGGGSVSEGLARAVYGVFTNPMDFGSGGGLGFGSYGGNGGGWAHLVALQVQLDGEIGADGTQLQDFGGGGSGGSVNLSVGTLWGVGSIHANGGGVLLAGGAPSCGGGGRIAIYFEDMGGFQGQIRARGGLACTNTSCFANNGGAGTVYLKKNGDAYGSLIVDNGDNDTVSWSTSLQNQGALRLLTWTIDGQARVSAPFPVRVSTGDPNYFLSLINSNYLQVGSLRVNDQWVYGDLIDLEINSSNAQPHVIFFSKPNSPYVIETSTNLLIWNPFLTNSPPDGLFDLIETNPNRHRFFRARQN